MKTTIICVALLSSSFSFSQLSGGGSLPVTCPPVITSPSWSSGPNKIFVSCPNVQVGIGTDTPTNNLHIATNDDEGISFVPNSSNQRSRIQFLDQSQNLNWDITAYNNFGGGYGNILEFSSHKGGDFWLNKSNMLIGDAFDFSGCSDCDEYRLFVKKGIRTQKLKVDIGAGIWADYVFSPSYELMPLSHLESYIQTNNHLPGIPSAKIVEEQGLDVGEMNAKLLEKVEELTLYLIEMNKEIESLKNKLAKTENHED